VADGGRSLLARRGRDLLARAPGPSGLLRDRLARQL
jgi:hypothetical protein